MSDNKRSLNINIDPYFIFCIAFAIVGVWFPSYFMWVVWAFVGYLAVSAALSIIVFIVAILAIRKWI